MDTCICQLHIIYIDRCIHITRYSRQKVRYHFGEMRSLRSLAARGAWCGISMIGLYPALSVLYIDILTVSLQGVWLDIEHLEMNGLDDWRIQIVRVYDSSQGGHYRVSRLVVLAEEGDEAS